MAVLIVIPIMGGIAFGFLDYLRKTEPKQLFPEKIWQVIVLAIVLINIILSLIGSENFIMDLVLCPFSGVIAYAILTGQGYLVAGGNGKNKGSWKEGKEYVVGTGLYRDKNGNYYTNTGTPTAAPVNTQHKSK